MKMVHGLIAIIALAFTLPAQAATTDPEVVLYRAAGVIDDGNQLATSFHCTPFSGVSENIRVVVRGQNGALLANSVATIPHLNTAIFSTHDVFIYGDVNMATGAATGGTVAIAATSTSVTCTAMEIQSNAANAVGIQLHMTRFNPLSGTQE